MHWLKAAKVKKQWERDVFYGYLTNKQHTKDMLSLPLTKAKVRITYYFKTHARRDIDNMNQKFILDGLVKAGIIVDDSTKVIGQVEVVPAFDKVNPRTEIEIFREVA